MDHRRLPVTAEDGYQVSLHVAVYAWSSSHKLPRSIRDDHSPLLHHKATSAHEFRIDPADNRSYSLDEFIAYYGGSRSFPPPEWTSAATTTVSNSNFQTPSPFTTPLRSAPSCPTSPRQTATPSGFPQPVNAINYLTHPPKSVFSKTAPDLKYPTGTDEHKNLHFIRRALGYLIKVICLSPRPSGLEKSTPSFLSFGVTPTICS